MLFVGLVCAHPILGGAASDPVFTCLNPCHSPPGTIGPDVKTTYLGSDDGAGHKMNWNERVVESTAGAQYAKGALMPCAQCHVLHGVTTSSIYRFSQTRTGGVVTAVRQLCEGCHRPSDSEATAPVVCGLTLKRLPSTVADHSDSSSRPCRDCHGEKGHSPEEHGSGAGGCIECHGHTGSHAIHVFAGDPRGPGGIVCTTCHASTFPFFAEGSDEDSSGAIELDEATVCDGCHSPDGDYDGVDDATIGAKPNWAAKAYETTSTLKAGKEKWCAGCHDDEPSVVESVSAPPVIGDEDGATPYGMGFGFYKTGHGLATGTAYPSSGGLTKGAGLGCDACHDFSKSHIDGDARTYTSSSGSSGYRDGYRLKRVDLGSGMIDPMTIPWTSSANPPVKERFALCASCHDPNPFTGADNETNLTWSGTNYHAYHIGFTGFRYDSDWSGGGDSRMNCPVCHNVHGSTRLAMVNDGALVGIPGGLQIWYYRDGVMEDEDSRPPVPAGITLLQSTGLLMYKASTVALCQGCHTNDWNALYARYYPLHWEGDNPALDWTWEPRYQGRAIPTDRLFDTTYDLPFHVRYFDSDDETPTSVQLRIDLDDDGVADPGESIEMTAADSDDATYTDGADFVTTVTVTSPVDKSLVYRFYATDGTSPALGNPTLEQNLEWDANFTRDVPGEYDSIQDAIDAAYDGNTVSVSDGTYAEGIDYDGKELVIASVNGAAVTTITGSGAQEPCVTFASGETSVVLRGFTIDNIGPAVEPVRGVMIQNGASPTIDECVITGNNTYTLSTGGGVYVGGGGLALVDSTVTANSAHDGGGLYAADSSQTISITGCSIDGNEAINGDGGGVRLVSIEQTVTFTDSSVDGNVSYGSGGGIGASDASVLLVGSTVSSNTVTHAPEYGGGVYVGGAASDLTLVDTVVDGNQCSSGAGIYFDGDELSITRGSVSGNIGVGQYDAGGIYTDSTATIAGTYIVGNRCGYSGGGVFHSSVGALTMTNCTVAGNRAGTYTFAHGGGIRCGSASDLVLNCTVAGNFAHEGGGIYGAGGTVANSAVWGNVTQLSYPNIESATVRYTDTSGGGWTDGGGNISADPMFVLFKAADSSEPTSGGDYHLQTLTPCEGVASATIAPPDDIDGDSRPMGKGDDMGSDEVFIAAGTPWLEWAGAAGYVSDGVDPDSAATGQDFEFRVEYSDEDSVAPAFVRVRVDADDNGSYEASESAEMAEVAGGDYGTGKVYRLVLPLTFAGDGALHYSFEASDGVRAALGWPTLDSTVTVLETSDRRVPQDYATIQAAIDAASDGEKILVAAGTYPENITFRGKAVTVESASGAAVTSIIGTTSPSTVDTPVVSFNSGEGTASVLRGFTIDNARANGTKSRGIYVSDAMPTIQGCIIQGNTLTNVYNGGGMLITGANSGAALSDTTIGASGVASNTARAGAGIYFENSTGGSLSLTRCVVQYNNALNNGGGGIYVSNCARPTVLTDTTITANVVANAAYYGGGVCASGSPLVITGCSITDHACGANVMGAGVGLFGASAEATVTGTTIARNTGDLGPGICVNSTSSGRLVVEDSVITQNSGDTNGGGIRNPWTTIVTGCSIVTNTVTGDGSGINAAGTSASLTVDGCTIRGNVANDGGGICFASSTSGAMLVTDTVISGNKGTATGMGGGVYLAAVTGTSTISNSKIEGNTATQCAGLYVSGAKVEVSRSRIADNLMSGTSYDGGGVMLTGAAANAYFRDSSVDGNSGRYGAGIRVAAGAKMTYVGSAPGSATVNGNFATTAIGLGGGVSVDGAGSGIVMSGSTIDSNTCGTVGGGVHVTNSGAATLTACTITRNSWNGGAVNADGGGVYSAANLCMDRCLVSGNNMRRYGAGLSVSGNATVTNTTIANNYLSGMNCYGGGIYWNATGSMLNCTIAGNHANLNTNNGGGLWFQGGAYTFKNLVVYGNWCSQGTGKEIGGTPAITYSDIGTTYAGAGNINQPPAFVATVAYSAAPTTSGDYHLKDGSPCEGVATSTGAPSLDIDNGTRPAGTGYDMGSDEIASEGEFTMMGAGAGGASGPLESEGALETLGGALVAGAAALALGSSGKFKDLVGKAIGAFKK